MSVQSSTENNTRMIRNSEVKSEVTRKIVLRHNLRTVGTVGEKKINGQVVEMVSTMFDGISTSVISM